MTAVTTTPSIEPAADSSLRDYVTLLKPRVMTLVVFCGAIGMWLAPGAGQLHPFLQILTILCIAIATGASGAINMWYDRDIDAVMKRTASRPVPSGRVTPANALAFGVVLSIISVALLGLALNWLAALLLTCAIATYIGIYTVWLKRRTPQNIVIGGAAGAFPPMIGWAAVTGDVSPASLLLFAIIFLWTPPHFWALALYRCQDYARAGVPMMPVVAGPIHTRRLIMLYSILVVATTLALPLTGAVGTLYLVTASALGAWFLFAAWKVWREGTDAQSMHLFKGSMLYLFALYSAMLIDQCLR